jgi:hypothetical protein
MSRAISQAVDLAPRVFALMASQLLCVGLSSYQLLPEVGKRVIEAKEERKDRMTGRRATLPRASQRASGTSCHPRSAGCIGITAHQGVTTP